MTYKIEVSKIDYYTWKIGAIAMLLLFLTYIYFTQTSDDKSEAICDQYHKLAYRECTSLNKCYSFMENVTQQIIGQLDCELIQPKT